MSKRSLSQQRKIEQERELKEKYKRNAELGRTLRSEREAIKAKGSWVAAELGISPAYLSDLEHGRRLWNDTMISFYRQALAKHTSR